MRAVLQMDGAVRLRWAGDQEQNRLYEMQSRAIVVQRSAMVDADEEETR